MFDLSSALASAKGGETIAVPAGDYGDVYLSAKFAVPVTLKAAGVVRLRSLNLRSCEGLTIEGFTVAFTPDAKTVADTSVVFVNECSRVTIRGGSISSGPAVNGVPEAAAALDATGNVIGWPTCRGVTINYSTDVMVEGVNIHDLHRGIIIGRSSMLTIRGNEIHHLRKTGILGGSPNVLIAENHLHSNRPWRYGQTPAGDHGDFIAIWNGDPTPMRNIALRDNRMETGEGVPMMGMWVQGGAGKAENVEFTGNKITGGDHQGIVLSDVRGGKVTANELRQDLASGKPIGIIIGDGCANVSATGNIAGSVSDKSAGATGNVVSGNTQPAAPAPTPPPVVTPPVVAPPPPPVVTPTPEVDALRAALLVRTGARLEPLKTKGRLIIEFKYPAQAQAALAALPKTL